MSWAAQPCFDTISSRFRLRSEEFLKNVILRGNAAATESHLLHLKEQPDRLPDGLYGTRGRCNFGHFDENFYLSKRCVTV
jgi:hypothetical protein